MTAQRKGTVAIGLWLATIAQLSAAQTSYAIPGGRVAAGQRGDATVLSITQAGHRGRIVLPPDDGIYANSLQAVSPVATSPGRFVILRLDHASRPNGPMHQCGAGTETMLRVIALRGGLHQTFHQLIASCWSTIDEGEVSWVEKTATLCVERTTYDPAVQDIRTCYRVPPDGIPVQTTVEHLP